MRFFWLVLAVIALVAGIRSIVLGLYAEEEKFVYIIGAILLPVVLFSLAYRSHIIAKAKAALERERMMHETAWEKLPKKVRRKLKKEQSEKTIGADAPGPDREGDGEAQA